MTAVLLRTARLDACSPVNGPDWRTREDSNLQPDRYIRTFAVRIFILPHIVFQLSPGISSKAGR